MQLLKTYHHFRANDIEPGDRVARCERLVVDRLLSTDVPDELRESSVAWEMKHQAGVTQMARIMARKRGLPLDSCTVGALFHDIYVIETGRYQDHAHQGGPIALALLDEVGAFSADEREQVHRIVYHHSDKDVWSEDAFQEFGKDVDVLDCFLYPNGFQYYLGNKRLEVFEHYLARAKRVWGELGIPQEPEFSILDGYGPDWLNANVFVASSHERLQTWLAAILSLNSLDPSTDVRPPACCVVVNGGSGGAVWSNRSNWTDFLARCDKAIPYLPEDRAAPVNILRSGLQGTDSDGSAPGEFWQESEHQRETATKILPAGGKAQRAVMLWLAVGMYEQLEGEAMKKRLQEVGVTPSRSKVIPNSQRRS